MEPTSPFVTSDQSQGIFADVDPPRLKQGETADILCLAGPELDKLIAAGFALPGSRVDLVLSKIGLAVKAGVPQPDISTTAAFIDTLRAAQSIGYSASASGTYLAQELFPRLGIWEEIKHTAKEVVKGRMSLDEILAQPAAAPDPSEFDNKEPFDVLVVGGGPAGASAAIYAARKGIRTGVITERLGGQTNDTLGIENFISVPYTEGPKLASSLEEHMRQYPIDVMKAQRAKGLTRKEWLEVELDNSAVLKSKTVILATGARWRQLGIPGEI